MSKKAIDKVIAGIALSAVAYFSLVGYDLYTEKHPTTQKNYGNNLATRIEQSCTYRLYTWKKPHLTVCTATAALDCSSSVEDNTSFSRTCTSSTICSEIQKLENGFREACALSSAPHNDLLLTLIKKERNQVLKNDGSYVLCEDWNCIKSQKCHHDDCVSCGKAEVKQKPCTFLFPEQFWRFRR